MAPYIRPDSRYYWIRYEGYRDRATGSPLREPTKIRHDAPTAKQRNENHELALEIYHARMTALAREESPSAPPQPPLGFREWAEWWRTHKLPHRKAKVRDG